MVTIDNAESYALFTIVAYTQKYHQLEFQDGYAMVSLRGFYQAQNQPGGKHTCAEEMTEAISQRANKRARLNEPLRNFG
jgi:hypothetical protein